MRWYHIAAALVWGSTMAIVNAPYPDTGTMMSSIGGTYAGAFFFTYLFVWAYRKLFRDDET